MVCFINNAYIYIYVSIVLNVLILPPPPTLPQLLLLLIIESKQVKPPDNAPLKPLLHRPPGLALHHASLLHLLPECDSSRVLASSVVQNEIDNRLKIAMFNNKSADEKRRKPGPELGYNSFPRSYILCCSQSRQSYHGQMCWMCPAPAWGRVVNIHNNLLA